jgi:ABC-2 type transport system ATP-binding protein
MFRPILTIEDLHKSYGDVEAVRGVSFQVARGEIFGLLGPNGAGKTTTLSMLAGLLQPDRGRILVEGVELRQQPNGVKGRMGLVPQELALYPTLSARDNLLFFGRIYGLRGRRLRQRVEAVLEVVLLTDRAGDAVTTFSGGMKRRLNIAAGLLHEPDILFLDEPTAGVDPQSRNAIFESVEALNRAGMTILYTTHYMEEAQRLCHRIAIMDHGRIIALDTPTALIHSLGAGLIRVGLPEAIADAVVAQMNRHPAVKAARRQDGRLHIEAHRTQEALVALLEATNRLGAPVTSLEILEPNLETVFLHLTGRQLRD